MSKYKVPSFIISVSHEDSDAGMAARLLLSTSIGNRARLEILDALQITDTQTLAARLEILRVLKSIIPIATNRQKDVHAIEMAKRLNVNINTPRTMLNLDAVDASINNKLSPIFNEPHQSDSGTFYRLVEFQEK